MKKSTFICTIILVLFTVAGLIPFLKHYEFTAKEAVVCECVCFRCRYAKDNGPVSDLWEIGEFVQYRKAYPHGRCGGQMVFNGKATPAPYSEKEYFYTHVCDKCGETNQILNATWPQYKQEWRTL